MLAQSLPDTSPDLGKFRRRVRAQKRPVHRSVRRGVRRMTKPDRKPPQPPSGSAGAQQAGTRFQKGQSGNPAGRRQGSRNTATIILDAMADGEAAAVLGRVLTAAKGGDLKAAEIILARIWPAKRGRPVRLDLPAVKTSHDVLAALGAVVDATSKGEITTDEAAAVANLLEIKRRSIEQVEIEERLARLEERGTLR